MPVADVKLLCWGSWPLLCPGSRDWTMRSTSIQLPAVSLRWPPANWHEMTPGQRSFALQTVAAMVSLQDERPGCFPMRSTAALLEDYSFLAFPGTASQSQGPLSGARRAIHGALRDTFTRHLSDHADMMLMLSASRSLGPPTRSVLLMQVNEEEVPLLPYFRHQELEVPGYDPCKPASWVATSCPLVRPGWVERWPHGSFAWSLAGSRPAMQSPPAALSWGLVEWRGDCMVVLCTPFLLVGPAMLSPPAALSWGLVEWRGDRMVAPHTQYIWVRTTLWMCICYSL